MDLLNLADGIFREFFHTLDMDNRCPMALQGHAFGRAE
jgi:hypothetical protein